eukprot:7019320-Heterocapsa_arctica.AAC.1
MSKLRVRTDGEPVIRALMALLARKRGVPELTTLEITPVKSSSLLGTAERYARTLAAMVRTLRFSLEDRMGVTVDVMSP